MELTPEFIQSVGVTDGSLETLKKEIKENVAREIKRRVYAKTRDNALQALTKVTPIEIPYALVHEEIHHMMDNASANMKEQGYPEDKIKLTHDMFEFDAKRFVTLRLLVQQYIKDKQISVTEEEIKHVVVDMASAYEDPVEYVSWYYQDTSRVSSARAIAMENKVIDGILAVTKTKDVEISYDDLIKLPV